MKVTGQTITTVLGICWGYAFGRWLITGGAIWLVPVIAVTMIPFVAFVFWMGHRHGYNARQAEVRATLASVLKRNPPTIP